ncbi:MAG TPA: ornithine carbamoyltransferase [Gemmatimonadales bacterium]|nr:ornithine carbamoyltransferase [Gemmatimonadales bacterium]
MTPRHFLTLSDLPPDELLALLELADAMKRGDYRATPLAGRAIALVFLKSSTRTRVSFEVGVHQLGGTPVVLYGHDIQLGRGEPLRDTARVLSRYVDGLMIRTFGHDDLTELTRFATIPVINGLTDRHHPCQLLADLLTMREAFGDVRGRRVAWIGDGNNVANSWIEAAGLLGFELRIACPEGYEPDSALFHAAAKRTAVMITEDPDEAVEGAHVVTTDVWASMGQEEEAERRRQAFAGYTVDEALMARARPEAIVLHCLPAHRGEEISEAVLEGPQSRVFDEAENRLHAQKALLAMLYR